MAFILGVICKISDTRGPIWIKFVGCIEFTLKVMGRDAKGFPSLHGICNFCLFLYGCTRLHGRFFQDLYFIRNSKKYLKVFKSVASGRKLDFHAAVLDIMKNLPRSTCVTPPNKRTSWSIT